MSLLPKTAQEFADSEYWNNFFKQRGHRSFEWYGEYAELCGFLHKYIKIKENILVIGCGNSKLSANMYDVGYRNITNIDISSTVIKQMKGQHGVDRPELLFLEMDALNMSFDSESFGVVLDKGTLDALAPNEDAKSKETAIKLFSEIERILKIGGRYVCVSLLQSHILDVILEQFVEKGWLIRICRCFEVEEKAIEDGATKSLPVFIVICTKFKKLPNAKPVLELSALKNGSITRLESVESLKKSVQEDQQVAFICNKLQVCALGDKEIKFDISDPAVKTPKYTISLVEKEDARCSNMRYAAFIVPQGRESEWLFSSSEGHQELLKGTGCDRLAVITLGRGHTFSLMEDVQEDLTGIVLQMAPTTHKPPIQFLSIGGDLGHRTQVAQGCSELSGEYIVEDFQDSDENTFRRLYFMSNKDIIQSEARIKKVKTRKGTKMVIDLSYLSCEHHAWIVVGLLTTLAPPPHLVAPSAAVVGLGGGSLCSFVRKLLPSYRLTAVELDPAIVTIATQHFGLEAGDFGLKVCVKDGLVWLEETLKQGVRYDAVIFDVDSKDKTLGLSCPPLSFVQPDVFKNVFDVLTDNGLFVLNLVCRDFNIKREVWIKLKRRFAAVASLQLTDDLNEVIFCWKRETEMENLLESAVVEFASVLKKAKMDGLKSVNNTFVRVNKSNLKDIFRVI